MAVKRVFKILLITIMLIILDSCTKNENKSTTELPNYFYRYTLNGCDTGKQTFETLLSYCSGLVNEDLNNNCARGFRLERWEKECH